MLVSPSLRDACNYRRIQAIRPNGTSPQSKAGLRPLGFTQRFVDILRVGGVKTVKLPARSPDLNAHAERFVLSVRTEYLRRMIPLGEKHLRAILSEFLAHYHSERNHQGLGNELLTPLLANTPAQPWLRTTRPSPSKVA